MSISASAAEPEADLGHDYDGPELHAGEVESFFQPTVSEQRGTV